jgi:hypothetical protein
MSALQDATDALRDLEAMLLAPDSEQIDRTAIAGRIHEVLQLLRGDEARWIETADAQRLLGVTVDSSVETWARLGLLRSRTLSDGRLHVALDDVLRRRAERDALLAFGGRDMTAEEMSAEAEARPGTYPWQRATTSR